jgi:superfamily II DNA or RNA helicase
MSTKFFTNKDDNTLFNKFKGIFEHNNNINHFDVLVGYFRSSGYFKLRQFLDNIDNVRILVGIDVDRLTQTSHSLGLVYQEDKENIGSSWQQDFINDIKQANYDEETEQGVKQFIQDMLNGKITLKAHPSKKIHAKIYIFRTNNFNEHTASSVITGSSNLTDSGLGTNHSSNYEFNVLLNDYEDVQFATDEFEKLWQESIDILPTVVEQGLKETHLADDITPYQLYLKMLIEYFGGEIDTPTLGNLPKEFKKLSYQTDAVHQGLLLLKKHNGFFLSDVVGLGKTVIATLIAREFWSNNGKDCSILIITPPAIKPNWITTIDKFNFNANIEIITNGSLDKVINKKYDLILVDEAHKFRNDATGGYTKLQRICKKTSVNLQGKVSVKYTKVILISATPLNNKPDDIFNQILLFQDKNKTTLDISLGHFFVESRARYNEIKNQENNSEDLKELYQEIRDKVISPLMVRRTRTDLTTIKRYKKDLKAQKIIFPNINKPKPIYYQLKEKLNTLFDETLKKINPLEDEQEQGLFYARYQAIHYLKPELKKNYKNADAMAVGLKGIMRTLLLKRMDSSFYAFNKTLKRFLSSSSAMINMFENDKIIITSDSKINEYLLEDNFAGIFDLEDKYEGKDYISCKKDDFEDGFIEAIKHDHKILKQLVKDWGENKDDPKIIEFNNQLNDLLKKENNPEQKIVIFTESSDTMNYLSNNIKQDYKNKVLSISAKNRDKLKETIKNNFDANIDKNQQENTYQIIITTDVLAEGVNLHRANTILNYDTPWNSTKLMQRIGRVNRIGSIADNIFIHNFYPTEQVDDVIGLEQNAKTKMQGFHSALGEDSQIYSPDEQVGTFGIFDKNIQEDKDERLVFLEEIKQFKINNPDEYKNIKKKPSKIRNTVKNNHYKNGTLSFVRTADKQSARFYFVNNERIENWSFIQSATLLKCDKQAIAEKVLPKKHYQQVTKSLETFNEEQLTTLTQTTQDLKISTQNTNLIKQFLEILLKIPKITEEQQRKIKFSIEVIKQGVYQSLSKDLIKIKIKLSKNKIILVEALEESIKIIDIDYKKTQDKGQEKQQDNMPTIVISQSYV